MTRRLSQIILPCLIAAGILSSSIVPTTALAADADIDSIVADEYEAELCGWGTCGWGTHDSAPIEVEAEEDCVTPTATPTRTAANFDASLAAIATAACANVGISVEQIIEPFAMVGPHLTQSYQSVQEFQRWWAAAAEQQANATDADPAAEGVVPENDNAPLEVSHVPIVDFDSEIPASEPWAENLASAADADATNDIEIDADSQLESNPGDDHSLLVVVDDEEIQQELKDLATEEPIDAIGADSDAFGPSILVVDSVKESEATIDSEPLAIDSIEIASIESKEPSMVGSSPMIFTINEAYLPYDLAVRDLHANGMLSLAKRPFCIRARMELPEFELAFDDLMTTVALERDEIDTQPEVEFDPNFVMSGSADCLLDDWVWRATLALEEDGSVRKWLRPELAGGQVVALVVKHNRVALGLADRLAKVWPRSDQPQPTAGAQLLARAEAVEADEEERQAGCSHVDDAQQLAQATAALKEWFTTLEGAATTLTSRWMPRLAKVSITRNDPGETSRR